MGALITRAARPGHAPSAWSAWHQQARAGGRRAGGGYKRERAGGRGQSAEGSERRRSYAAALRRAERG